MAEVPDHPDMQTVTWDDIEDAATSIFDVWVGSPELGWAGSTWERLGKLGLTAYANDIERNVVLLRLAALGILYREFCSRAWDEPMELDLVLLTDGLDLSTFRLAQHVGAAFEPDSNAMDDVDLMIAAVQRLVEGEYEKVTSALLRSASPSELFATLWLSDSEHSGVAFDELNREVLDEALNDVTDEKLDAFSWIDEGMPR